jgi:hypothetical protein
MSYDYTTLCARPPSGRFGGPQALQEPFFSAPAAGWCGKWIDLEAGYPLGVSPNPSIAQVASLIKKKKCINILLL